MHATHLAPVRRRSTWAGAAALVSVLAVSGAA